MFKYKTENNTSEVVVSLLQTFIDESVYTLKVDKDKVHQLVTNDNILTIVVYSKETPVALFMGYTYNHPLFDGKAADDLVIFVHKDYRGGSIAVRLIKMYEAWAKHHKVSYIQISQATGTGDVQRIRSFYERLGYKTTGYNAMKEV